MPTAADVARGENAKALADVAKSAKRTNFFMMDILLLLWIKIQRYRGGRGGGVRRPVGGSTGVTEGRGLEDAKPQERRKMEESC